MPIVFVASGCSKCRCLGLCDSCCCSCSWSCSHSCSCSSSRSSSHFSKRHIPSGLWRTPVDIIVFAISITISASELELCPLQRQLASPSHFQEQAAASAGSLLWRLSEEVRNTHTGNSEGSTIEQTERQADVNISHPFYFRDRRHVRSIWRLSLPPLYRLRCNIGISGLAICEISQLSQGSHNRLTGSGANAATELIESTHSPVSSCRLCHTSI